MNPNKVVDIQLPTIINEIYSRRNNWYSLAHVTFT